MDQDSNKKFQRCKPHIANIVANGQFPKNLDLVKIYEKINFPIKEYEPDQYPALLVKVNVRDNLRHVTIYKNGKYIITGALSEEEVYEIYKTIYDILDRAGFF